MLFIKTTRLSTISNMQFTKKLLSWFDGVQRRHGAVGFPLAVVKKYGEDEASYKAALLAYYGFLSLFPLLLVLTTVLGIVLKHHTELRDSITHAAITYFPVVGNNLEDNVHTLGKTGVALAIGILLTLYGARGVADAFRYGVNHVWQVPHDERESFPVNVLKSFAIIIVGGLGLIAASLIAGYGTTGGSLVLSVLTVAGSTLILFSLFTFLIKISLPTHVKFKELWVGAAVIAIGLAVLQFAGGFLVTHQLKNMNNLYGTFAVVLGLLFWIYLQAQVIFYALEVETVRALRLWPRSLVSENLTPEDKRAYKLYVQRNRYIERQRTRTTYVKTNGS
jgi:YihY family inner membrane protein